MNPIKLSENPEENKNTVAARIRTLRVKRGLTIADLARKTGVAATTLREWEQGRRIRGEPYERIAAGLGVSTSELLLGDSATKASIAEDLENIEKLIARVRSKL